MNAPANIVAPPALNMKGAAPFSLPERMIAGRYLRAKKSEGGVALIAGISFACIMLAVTAMIVIMSVMNGFRSTLIDLTVGAEPHVIVSPVSGDPTEADLDTLAATLSGLPDVVNAFPYTEDLAGVQANGRISYAKVSGVRPDDLRAFGTIADNIIIGTADSFGQGRGSENEILIGYRLADQLGLTVGDRATIVSGKTRSSAFGTSPILKPYTVGGLIQTGLVQTDSSAIYMSLEQSNLLFNEGALRPDVQMRLTDADRIDTAVESVKGVLPGAVYIETWRDRIGSLAVALRTEQVAMRLIFMIVVVISTFPVLAAMIMLVKNKSRDIAILRTIGATRGSVLRIFFMTGAMIGILGTVVGLILGVVIAVNVGAIQNFLEAVFGWELFPADAYALDGGLPVKIIWSEVGMVAVWGILISFIATLLPALSASKTDPVDALRYE